MSTPTPTSLPDNQEESQLKQVFTKTAHSTDVKENTQEVDQFTQIFITAAGELFKYIKPSKEAVQQIHNHRNDLAQAIYKGTLPLLKELSDTSRYKEEEVVSSDFKYHSRYKKSKSIVRQLKILDRIFPGLLFDKKRFFSEILGGLPGIWSQIVKLRNIPKDVLSFHDGECLPRPMLGQYRCYLKQSVGLKKANSTTIVVALS